VDYDDQVIKMQRAKLVNDMESGVRSQRHEEVNTGMDFISKASSNKPGFNEKGMKSNNQEV
jgi:hypothetical protein